MYSMIKLLLFFNLTAIQIPFTPLTPTKSGRDKKTYETKVNPPWSQLACLAL